VAGHDLPVLIVGDVHGDLERLFEALKPYPADQWHTVFVGDLVDYGMFGVGALRFARDRPNTDLVLGNHEVALLWALRDSSRIGWWLSIGGQRHDLDELAGDEDLQGWLKQRPALIKLDDATLVQHCGHDGYKQWLNEVAQDPIASINDQVHALLNEGHEDELWEVLSAKNAFAHHPMRLQQWLQATKSRRVLFGHVPHNQPHPEIYHEGTAINFDGALSRRHKYHRRSPISASVAPLQPLS
jgi:Calcineurin-like phosphoesterase